MEFLHMQFLSAREKNLTYTGHPCKIEVFVKQLKDFYAY